MDLPQLIKCDDIFNETSEIFTPDVAESYPHQLRNTFSIPELYANSKNSY